MFPSALLRFLPPTLSPAVPDVRSPKTTLRQPHHCCTPSSCPVRWGRSRQHPRQHRSARPCALWHVVAPGTVSEQQGNRSLCRHRNCCTSQGSVSSHYSCLWHWLLTGKARCSLQSNLPKENGFCSFSLKKVVLW